MKRYWIQDALSGSRKGALRKKLHAKEGKPIPAAKLREAAKAPGKLGKQARLAITLRKLGRNR